MQIFCREQKQYIVPPKSYQARDQGRAVDARGLDELEEVDHTLSLHPLQLSMDADEGARATHSVADGRARGER